MVILGGGLAGLSTAWHLENGGYHNYHVFERESKVGGLARSENVNGFTFDFTSQLLFLKNPYVKDLVSKLLNLDINRVGVNCWIFSKNAYTRYPFQTNTFGLPKEVVKECIIGFVEARYGKNKISLRDRSGQTFEDWIYENFGVGIAKHFMIPYNEKFWMVHPRDLTCEWIDGSVPKTSLEEILDGALSAQLQDRGHGGDSYYYPNQGGMETLPKAFASSIRNIHLNSEACEIDLVEKSVTFKNGERMQYAKLFSSIPLPQLGKMIKAIPVDIQDSLARLRYNRVFNINLGIDRKMSDKHWIYFPEQEYLFYRVGFPSNFSASMAPEESSSLCVEIAYSQDGNFDRTKAIERVKKELVKVKILSESDRILVEKTFDTEYAHVLYDANHRDNVSRIRDFLERNDIYTIGRYGSWDYSGIEDVILNGSKVADEIIRLEKEVYTLRPPKPAPIVSIVIPVYNEEKVLEPFARQIVEAVDKLGIDYELILCENGSSDRTAQIAEELSTVYPRVRAVHYPEPNYGKALALGILNSTGQNVVCFEIDFWDPDFVEISKALLKKYDSVVGSKRAPGARDRRPWIRRMITFGFNMLLKIVFGFQGTDTHGIKAFRRDKVLQIVPECQTGKDIFATELVLRMERAGLYMCEIPLEIEERRPPSIKLLKRVPSTIRNLIKLWKVTRNLDRSGRKKLEKGPKISGVKR